MITGLQRGLRDAWPAGITLLLLVVLWEGVVSALDVPRFVLPRPSAIAALLAKRPGLFASNTLQTLKEFGLGLVTSVAIGIPLGIAAAKVGWFSRSLYPVIVATQSVPKLALAPLFVVWLGFGIVPKAAIAFLIAFFPVMVNTAAGVAGVDADLKLLARSLGFSPWRQFLKFELPAAAPMIFAGIKVAAPFAVIGSVVGEFLGADAGLGKLTLTASTTLDTTLMFAALTLLAIIGLGSYLIVAILERQLVSWHIEQANRLVGTGL